MTISSSLDVPTVSSCAFCEYLTGARPYTFWERTQATATLVTREQRGEFHLLVIPVRHTETILDLHDSEADHLMRAVRRASKAIDRAAQPSGLSIWQNNGVPASQTIPHVHFHVAGTLAGGGTDWNDVRELSLQETQAIADALGPPPVVL